MFSKDWGKILKSMTTVALKRSKIESTINETLRTSADDFLSCLCDVYEESVNKESIDPVAEGEVDQNTCLPMENEETVDDPIPQNEAILMKGVHRFISDDPWKVGRQKIIDRNFQHTRAEREKVTRRKGVLRD